ncbi:hypothetical protein DFH09DRAFT_1319939 [Mycena vulgaris]|nr:hypothetical protein DFH09DRAFT_1319939 [Mycena vulgaris]
MSSLTSSTSSSSSRAPSPTVSAGVYVPIHRRFSSTNSAEFTRPIPKLYTPVELMQLAQSPLTMEHYLTMRVPLGAFPEIARPTPPRVLTTERPDMGSMFKNLTAAPRSQVGGLNYNRNSGLNLITDVSSWRARVSMNPLLV